MGHMPLHLVTTDLASGTLVGIRVQDVPRAAPTPMSADSRTDALPGPAGRTFIAQLQQRSDPQSTRGP